MFYAFCLFDHTADVSDKTTDPSSSFTELSDKGRWSAVNIYVASVRVQQNIV